MSAQDPDQYSSITKELYNKNVDLVNANKVLELIQDLYEIMISSYSIESISHRFINLIVEKMGFSDGIVVVRDKDSNNLSISGLTQTQLNQTIMDLAGLATVEYKFDTNIADNLLVDTYNTGQSKASKKIYNVWTPYVKPGDLAGINQALENQLILSYPILYGKEILGSFALIAGNKQDISDFEKKALEKIVTVFGIAMDRVKINEQLQKAHERELSKAREVINLKDQFVFIATHDLRTPVTAIRGYSDLLRPIIEDKLDEDAKEDFDAIYESADRLDQLVEDLLEVARSESGKIYIETKPVNIMEFIKSSVSELKTKASERNISINLDIEDEEYKILGDPEKLHEISENLLSNAIKYNKDNGSVTVKAYRKDNFVEFTFSDTGIGIPKDLQSQVFEKFFRARQRGTESVPGTGLGLFVVRMLIEKMKGEIKFESKEGEGTTFVFRLPIAD